jgi:hypothetical protein
MVYDCWWTRVFESKRLDGRPRDGERLGEVRRGWASCGGSFAVSHFQRALNVGVGCCGVGSVWGVGGVGWGRVGLVGGEIGGSFLILTRPPPPPPPPQIVPPPQGFAPAAEQGELRMGQRDSESAWDSGRPMLAAPARPRPPCPPLSPLLEVDSSRALRRATRRAVRSPTKGFPQIRRSAREIAEGSPADLRI